MRPRLGSGELFKAIAERAKEEGMRSPGGVAYTAGRKAHSKAEMTRLAVAGKKRRHKK